MEIEVSRYEKKDGVHTFYLVIPSLNVKTYAAFDGVELRLNPKIHQIKALVDVRIKDGIYDMLAFTQEKNIIKFIAEHIDVEDIYLKMLVIMMEPKLGEL